MHAQETVHSLAGEWGRQRAYVLTDGWRRSFEMKPSTANKGNMYNAFERERVRRVHLLEAQPPEVARRPTKLLPDVARLRTVYMDMTGAEDFPLRLERTRARAVSSAHKCDWGTVTLKSSPRVRARSVDQR